MKYSAKARKNSVILSLILMLSLISYVNYDLNRQSFLKTSDDLKEYELTMMEENDIPINSPEEEAVFNEVAANSSKVVDSLEDDQIKKLVNITTEEISNSVTSKKLIKSQSYFIESRLERDKKRSEMVSNLNDIIDNRNTTEDLRAEAVSMKLSTITNTDKEVFLENMIIAKGYNDAIVHLSEKTVNIVVGSGNLTEIDVVKIVNIVMKETDFSIDDIIIMNKK